MSSVVRENVPLAPYTTFRLGGPARYFVNARTVDDVVFAVKFARERGLRVLPLGAGSDVLVPDSGFDGLVVRLVNLRGAVWNGNLLKAMAGEPLPKLAKEGAARGLSGLEYVVGVPGTVGGGVAKNAGAHGREMKDVLVEAYVVDEDGYVRTLKREELSLSYRSSSLPREGILVEALLKLREDDPAQIRRRIEEFLAYRERTQPWTERTAGCMFKNPPGDYAGRLIDMAGLKGFRIGGVKVSEKHANFFINEGGTADDAIRLIEHVRERVFEVFGIQLEVEIEILR
ncbi:MAG: UDP-N-acetylmuramate dehydrogenase [Thermotogae bacterium]|nr:UDP-N-acetylmuramate dehydrogenase [Thermotogota bacterium]